MSAAESKRIVSAEIDGRELIFELDDRPLGAGTPAGILNWVDGVSWQVAANLWLPAKNVHTDAEGSRLANIDVNQTPLKFDQFGIEETEKIQSAAEGWPVEVLTADDGSGWAEVRMVLWAPAGKVQRASGE